MTFQYANSDHPPPPSPLPISFTLTAPEKTDIWREPPGTERFNAPILYQKFDSLSDFKRARVVVQAEWKLQYDQAGLILVLNHADGSKKWVKSGVEFVNGAANASTVSCDRWADWSLVPLEGPSLTVEMERKVKNGKPTDTLCVFVVQGVERRVVREVAWAFEGTDTAHGWVGVYAARPGNEDGQESKALEVSFDHFLVESA